MPVMIRLTKIFLSEKLVVFSSFLSHSLSQDRRSYMVYLFTISTSFTVYDVSKTDSNSNPLMLG